MSVLGYAVVTFVRGAAHHVDSYSGFGGDIYLDRAEAEEILGLTRSTMSLHRPDAQYELAELRLVEAAA